MRLTRTTAYALRALAYLARHGREAPVPSRLIARAGGVSENFLHKVLEPLAAAGVLTSVPGPHGGYRLARPAKGITLLEVVEGPVRGEVPPVGADAEGRRFDARLQAACEKAADVTRRQLRRVSLADLAGE
jgi:Rrf2 family protein